MRKILADQKMIVLLMVIQFIPLVIFPLSSYAPNSQEWWLPAMLAILAAVAFFQIVVRRVPSMGPWYLLSFSQGFNIISRLMMLMPHATLNQDGKSVFNTPYVSITLVSMLISAFLLWYFELPEVRNSWLRK
jgi:hypothetical protein